MPILSKKKAGNTFNGRTAEQKRLNAEMRMKKERKNTAKAVKMLESRGPSKGNINRNRFAHAVAPGPHNHLHRLHGGTRRIRSRKASSRKASSRKASSRKASRRN